MLAREGLQVHLATRHCSARAAVSASCCPTHALPVSFYQVDAVEPLATLGGADYAAARAAAAAEAEAAAAGAGSSDKKKKKKKKKATPQVRAALVSKPS